MRISVRRSALLLCMGLFGLTAHGGASHAGAQETRLLVVVGLGGDEEHRDRFHEMASRLVEAAIGPLGLPPESVIYLGERPDRDPGVIDGRSTREDVREALHRIGAEAPSDAQVVMVVIGHGSQQDGEARINLPGPDLTAGELAGLLDALGDRAVTVIHTTSASGGFLESLSAPGRVVMTATRSAREGNETRFPEHLVAAFTDGGSDTDKDGRISMLEAFTYTRLEVARSYERDGILLTEHALLDDDGDGIGSPAPPEEGSDGALARTRFLSPGAGRPAVADDPELAGLYARRDSLQARIEALRARRGEIEETEYERQLEALLVDLALVAREIRTREGGGA